MIAEQRSPVACLSDKLLCICSYDGIFLLRLVQWHNIVHVCHDIAMAEDTNPPAMTYCIVKGEK